MGKRPKNDSLGITDAPVLAFQYWGKPRSIRDPQGTNKEVIIKTPADPEKLEALRAEKAKYSKNGRKGLL